MPLCKCGKQTAYKGLLRKCGIQRTYEEANGASGQVLRGESGGSSKLRRLCRKLRINLQAGRKIPRPAVGYLAGSQQRGTWAGQGARAFVRIYLNSHPKCGQTLISMSALPVCASLACPVPYSARFRSLPQENLGFWQPGFHMEPVLAN